LTNLLAKDVPFHFFEECYRTFFKLKDTLTSAPVLHPPMRGEAFELMYNASNYVIELVYMLIKRPMSFIKLVTFSMMSN